MATVDEKSVPIIHESDIVAARQAGRAMAQDLGFSSTDQVLIATAISEVARNIVSYAGTGCIKLSWLREGRKHGICVVAQDQGPGIADIALAMKEGYSTARSLGMGLPGARRLMDDLQITSGLGQGTTVTLKKWQDRVGGPWVPPRAR